MSNIIKTTNNIKKLETIAFLLGGTVRGTPYEHGGSIDFGSGSRDEPSIFIRLSGGRGKKGSASGSFPLDVGGSAMSGKSWGVGESGEFEIGFSEEKDAESVAQDIKRRLLPKYLAAFEKALAKKNERQNWEDKRLSNLDLLASALGTVRTTNEKDSFTKLGETFYVQVQAGDATAQLNIRSLPIACALKVCELLKTWENAQT
jgi:hypothetical protein